MFQEYFHGNEWLTLPLASLVFFFGWFMVVLWRVVFRMRDKEHVQALASLPFTDDERQRAREESHHG